MKTKPPLRRIATYILLCAYATPACSEADDLPIGPCNDDGNTASEEGELVNPTLDSPEVALPGPLNPRDPANELRPALPTPEGWAEAPSLDGLYRHATVGELRRLRLPEHTLVLAAPFGIIEEEEGTAMGFAWTRLPTWEADQEEWTSNKQGQVVFVREEFSKVQTLSLGHFVEHHSTMDGASAEEVRHPIFDLYGVRDSGDRSSGQLLTDSSGALLIRRQTPQGRIQLSAPHAHHQLDIPPPLGFQVALVSPSVQDITRDPLTPFNCENGECEDPDDPLDECNDGIDNDDDGHQDLCDWKCLPHDDFGAYHYPQARSRIESGKNYALMGGGGICTELGGTWMVAFADLALQSSEFLNTIRPGENDAVHYRIFSCWVFEDSETFLECQHGLQFEDGEPVGMGDPVCPPGMEGYPYQPPPSDTQPGLLLYDEATRGAWRDLSLNTVALGPYGEPVNGVGFMTNDTTQTCEDVACAPAAGLAAVSPFSDIWDLGHFVATDANQNDWLTLAHETAHTLGMVHDNSTGGFMSADDLGPLPELGTSVDPEHPEVDNNVVWERAFTSKHSHPRSSGWYWTGCYETEHVCAPLGKPGWFCKEAWCEPD